MSTTTVTAVVCTRNRPHDLERTLQSIAWQTAPCEQILVIDDSDPEGRERTVEIAAEIDAPIKVITKELPGLTASRNLAIELSTGDLTAFFDDDVVLHPAYVAEVRSAFDADPRLAGAGGSVDDDHVYGWRLLRAALRVPGRATGQVYRSGWSTQLPKESSRPVEHLIGCNMVYRTDVLSQYRFDERFAGYGLGEDLEFSHRLHRDGHRLAAVGSARLWHLTAPARQDRAWGYREMVIRPMIAGERFSTSTFLVGALTFVSTNLVRNRERAAGNWLGIRDVIRGRPPRDLQTIRKDGDQHTTPGVAMIGSRGFPGQTGGVERVLEAVGPRIVDRSDTSVRVYCPTWLDYTEPTYRGVELERVAGLRSKYGDTFTRSLRATLREMRSDTRIVHYHSIGSAPLAVLPRLAGKKVVVTVHALDWQRSKWNVAARTFLRFGEWASVRIPHRTVAVGADLAEQLRTSHGREVTYIPNGAEDRTPRDPELILEAGLEPQRYHLFLARLVPEKGVHVLIEAFRRLPDDGTKLAIAGPGWYEPEYEARLHELAGDDPRVVFLGEVDGRLLEELYSNCLAYVLPSEVEGMSLSLLDALAFGCCIISSSIPPNTYLVGDSALIFETGDVDSLEARLREVHGDPELVERLRRSAAARGRRHSWDAIADQWVSLYRELVEA